MLESDVVFVERRPMTRQGCQLEITPCLHLTVCLCWWGHLRPQQYQTKHTVPLTQRQLPPLLAYAKPLRT